jgi:cytochrome b involved in lipid metabolism
MTRKIAYSELKEHAKEQDLWLLIDGKVYDVTKFYDEHPGGGDMLLGSSGTLCLPHGMKIDRSDTLQAPPSSCPPPTPHSDSHNHSCRAL